MEFKFSLVKSLPRLAWCARLRLGRGVVDVHHGPSVEARGSWFVEGAWDSEFVAGPSLETLCMAGSGGRVTANDVIFIGPSNMVDRIQSVRVGDELCVSNSIPFLLVATDDEPDPAYRFYYDDLVSYSRVGISRTRKPWRTRRGRTILLHDHGSLRIGPNLELRRTEKENPPPPADYAGYVGMLEGAMERVFRNAADPARVGSRYTPLATLSGGYDANALAVLTRRLGGREGMTFVQPGFDGTRREDHGLEIGRSLGFEVTPYERMGFLKLPGAPEAEFCACPDGKDVVMAPVEPQLEGRVLITGRYGDNILSVENHCGPGRHPNSDEGLDAVGRFMRNAYSTPGMSMNEFRLRVGFVQFPAFYFGARHALALHKISNSPVMAPWSVGGSYDRPIARRIIEEAGIPRDWFGRQKMDSAKFRLGGVQELSAGGRDDFTRFLREAPAMSRLQRWKSKGRLAMIFLQATGRPRKATPSRALLRTEMDFVTHWGFARIRDRYRIP